MNKPFKIDSEFYDAVKYLVTIQSLKSFENSAGSHALAFFKAMFEKSSYGLIRIFTYNLCDDLSNSDEYIKALKYFLKKGYVKFLLKTIPNSKELNEKEIFKTLRSIDKKKYEIKKTDEKATLEYGEPKLRYEINFSTGDDNIYRIEYDINYPFKAKCCFNDEKVTNRLNTLFDKSFSTATSIDL